MLNCNISLNAETCILQEYTGKHFVKGILSFEKKTHHNPGKIII